MIGHGGKTFPIKTKLGTTYFSAPINNHQGNPATTNLPTGILEYMDLPDVENKISGQVNSKDHKGHAYNHPCWDTVEGGKHKLSNDQTECLVRAVTNVIKNSQSFKAEKYTIVGTSLIYHGDHIATSKQIA